MPEKSFTNAIISVVAHAGAEFVYPGAVSPELMGATGPSCRYERDGDADCLIGRALHRLGVTIEQLAAADRNGNGAAAEVMQYLGIGTPRERAAADAAQGLQDRGSTWGEALGEYLRVMKSSIINNGE